MPEGSSVGGLAPGSQKCLGSRKEGGLGKAFLTVADEESSSLGLTPSASSADDEHMYINSAVWPAEHTGKLRVRLVMQCISRAGV